MAKANKKTLAVVATDEQARAELTATTDAHKAEKAGRRTSGKPSVKMARFVTELVIKAFNTCVDSKGETITVRMDLAKHEERQAMHKIIREAFIDPGAPSALNTLDFKVEKDTDAIKRTGDPKARAETIGDLLGLDAKRISAIRAHVDQGMPQKAAEQLVDGKINFLEACRLTVEAAAASK